MRNIRKLAKLTSKMEEAFKGKGQRKLTGIE